MLATLMFLVGLGIVIVVALFLIATAFAGSILREAYKAIFNKR